MKILAFCTAASVALVGGLVAAPALAGDVQAPVIATAARSA